MINLSKLIDYLTVSTDRLFKLNKKDTYYYKDKQARFIYKDNGGDILAVAHVDTVLSVENQSIKIKGKRLHAKGLDDRLGCYIACELLAELGIKADILLTDNEEIGQSTAQFVSEVIKPDRYRYIVEFDRAGDDYVDYDLGSVEMDKHIMQLGINKGMGAFSDICFLPPEFDSVPAINWGIGYQFAHSKTSYCDLNVLKSQMEKFAEFYEVTKDIVFERDIWDTSTKYDYWEKDNDIDCYWYEDDNGDYYWYDDNEKYYQYDDSDNAFFNYCEDDDIYRTKIA